MAKRLSAHEFKAFLETLEPERRDSVEIIRRLILKNLPAGYEEVASGKMLAYQVPLATYPDTNNKKPLWYAALKSEKSYLSLHLMPIYGNKELLRKMKANFDAAGKKLNMGKACVRFKATEDLALDAIAEVIGAVPMDSWIEFAKLAWRR